MFASFYRSSHSSILLRPWFYHLNILCQVIVPFLGFGLIITGCQLTYFTFPWTTHLIVPVLGFWLKGSLGIFYFIVRLLKPNGNSSLIFSHITIFSLPSLPFSYPLILSSSSLLLTFSFLNVFYCNYFLFILFFFCVSVLSKLCFFKLLRLNVIYDMSLIKKKIK